jgi:rhamnulokinase
MPEKAYLAIDLGASSGRHVVGRFDGETISLEEVYRFENGPVRMGEHIYWDLPGQWAEILKGMQAAGAAFGSSVASVGVDTWGVDYALIGRRDTLLGIPYHYRDHRTDGILEKALQSVSREEIFQETGLQFMPINTLYQLLEMKWNGSPLLDSAERLLMMPDVFHWLMSGEKSNEFTDATTTQCFNPLRNDWSSALLEKFGLPRDLFGPISPPGTSLGGLRQEIASSTALSEARVVLPGSHDTASAVMAVPTLAHSQRSNWCYISLGTWALMGIESPEPVVNETVGSLNFTNEGGVGGTYRILKNICGLWLVQECRRIWNQQGKNWGWEDLNRLSAAAQPRRTFIDPDAPAFLAPADMPEEIRRFAEQTGQKVPDSEGDVLRCALDSLALKFRHVLNMCEQISGNRIETIHVLGGGTKNEQLCQATADACGRPVVAGPVEATATGNLMLQAVSAGDVADIAQAREIIRNSFQMVEYAPRNTDAWDEAYETFREYLV